jgi:hypothetical protein
MPNPQSHRLNATGANVKHFRKRGPVRLPPRVRAIQLNGATSRKFRGGTKSFFPEAENRPLRQLPSRKVLKTTARAVGSHVAALPKLEMRLISMVLTVKNFVPHEDYFATDETRMHANAGSAAAIKTTNMRQQRQQREKKHSGSASSAPSCAVSSTNLPKIRVSSVAENCLGYRAQPALGDSPNAGSCLGVSERRRG